MKVLVLYRPNSEHGRLVEDFIRDYKRAGHNGHMEALNIDTREGAAMASVYDVMEYPGIIVIRDDGSVLRAWQGSQLPMQNEVAAYAYS